MFTLHLTPFSFQNRAKKEHQSMLGSDAIWGSRSRVALRPDAVHTIPNSQLWLKGGVHVQGLGTGNLCWGQSQYHQAHIRCKRRRTSNICQCQNDQKNPRPQLVIGH